MYKEMMDSIGMIQSIDPELGSAMNEELHRQRQNIELIASENIVSPGVMAAMGSVLTNKYAEGLPGKRYYGGCELVDKVERIAIKRACELFGAKYANVQPHSGAQANLAVYFALLDLGDTVMGMDLSQGGHLSHGSPVNQSGKNYHFVSYGVNEDGFIDYAELEKAVKKHRPKLIVAGASAYPRAIDFEKMAEIAHGYGAYLMVDMAHIAGLVAGGQLVSGIVLNGDSTAGLLAHDPGELLGAVHPGRGLRGGAGELPGHFLELASGSGSIIAAVGSGIAGSVIAPAAGHQGQSHGERQEQCKKLFHCFASLK